jgi:3-phosphoshikimate 1-carboxyvinyltransferase
MPLPDLLPIPPFTRPVCGEVALPGSKSLTNRALLLAALCDRAVTLTGALFSDDTRLMAEALSELGFTVTADEAAATLRVSNQRNGFNVGSADLYVGLAGTAARFLTALCAAAPRGVYRLDGVPQMRKRPMKGLIDALRAIGADIRCTGEEGFFPLEIHARKLKGGPVEIDASESSQMLSALLMVAPLAERDVQITLRGSVRWAYVDMTDHVMRSFHPKKGSLVNRLGPQSFAVQAQPRPYGPAGNYAIDADASAASYFLALPLVTRGTLKLLGARPAGDPLQGDTAFAEVVREVGAIVTTLPDGLQVDFSGGPRHTIGERNFKAISDTFLTIAALSPLLDGPMHITGIAHSRKQETDRVDGMFNELKRLGQDVEQGEDWLKINPRPLVPGQTIETYHDHRFAMSFGILGCHDLLGNGQPWLTLRDPGCCAKTFPHFFDLLEALRQKSLQPANDASPA